MSNHDASDDDGIDRMERELEEKKRRKRMREMEREEEETRKRFEAAQERRRRLLAEEAAEEARQAKRVQVEKAVRKDTMTGKHEKSKRKLIKLICLRTAGFPDGGAIGGDHAVHAGVTSGNYDVGGSIGGGKAGKKGDEEEKEEGAKGGGRPEQGRPTARLRERGEQRAVRGLCGG
jgi:hypothetical protein